MRERLGHYQLLHELGRGGMGEVYLAKDENLGRLVALKVLPAEVAADATCRARFEREAKAAAGLDHPGIVTVHSFEKDDGVHFITMQYVEGPTLSGVIAEEPLSGVRLHRLGRQLAAAVGAAHAVGIIHRDIKPLNVMVTADDVIKVLDFGLARFYQPSSDYDVDDKTDDTPTAASELTREGAVLGTASYMSPEQVRGEKLDARSDVFSLGVVLYEMASGQRPFTGSSRPDVTASILRDTPKPLAGLRPELPQALAAIVERCLGKDRTTRFATAVEVAAAMEAIAVAGSAPIVAAEVTPVAKGHVPAERDTFVGRTQELGEFDRQLRSGVRLLTVLGPGGIGKTRLVQHYGRSQMASWPGGVWFCDLSEARSLEGVVHSVAKALDVPLGGGEPVVKLGNAIAGRGRCLVVLDNFEQVKEEAKETLGRWLGHAGEAQFVVTSRVRLELAGEQDFPLEPLPAEREGVELFVVRARARNPGFAQTDENRDDLLKVVQLLDSLPLAIELAAARVRVLSLDKIHTRLKDRFKLLVGGERGSRQETLEATIDWSWQMLEHWEKATLAQASVFERGFTLEAAEAVLDMSAWKEAPDVLDVVQALVDKSLLRTSEARPSDEPRLGMYVSIQQYAATKLGTEDAVADGGSGAAAEEAAMRRHGTYYAAFGSDETLQSHFCHGSVERSRELKAEIDNVVVACRRALARGDGATAVCAARAAEHALRQQGPLTIVIDLLDGALALGTLSRADEARALAALAVAADAAGRPVGAEEQFRAAIVLFGAVRDRQLALTHVALSHLLINLNSRLTEAREQLALGLEIQRELGDRSGEGRSLTVLGTLLTAEGRPDEARTQLLAALAVNREVGNRIGEARVFAALGLLAQKAFGRLDEACTQFGAAIPIFREVGDRINAGIAQGNLGGVLLELGNLAEAEEVFRAALATHRETGFGMGPGYWLNGLSQIARRRGAVADAVRLGEEAVAAAQNWPGVQAEFSAGLAAARLAAGDLYGARSAIDAAVSGAPQQLERLKVLVALVAVQRAEGDDDAARATLREAETLSADLELRPATATAREIAVLRATLGGGSSDDDG